MQCREIRKIVRELRARHRESSSFSAHFEKIKDKVLSVSKTDEFKEMYYLFTHCTERALITQSPVLWQTILSTFGLNLIPVNVACCGMAGLFGHMAANQKQTYAVYEKNWKPEISKRDFNHCLITGFSCRSQVQRMEGKKAIHPLFVVDELLKKALNG